MLTAYRLGEKGLEEAATGASPELPPEAAWVDLHQPTPAEDRLADCADACVVTQSSIASAIAERVTGTSCS